MASEKARVLLVGGGGVGTMAAYALEMGGKAEVTAVLRSNYSVVKERGFDIDSFQWGHDIKGWRPTEILPKVPDVAGSGMKPFDYLLVTTKNIPDVPPGVADIIAPAVTPGHTAIILSQNGLNIETPVIARFPTNPVISSISRLGVAETSHGKILHEDSDSQTIGPFANPNVPFERAEELSKKYVELYGAAGRVEVLYEADVRFTRWKKLLYNASYNTVCTVLRMDTTRMRVSRHVVDDLIRPIMLEIVSAAKACGTHLPPDLVETLIRHDPTDVINKPSMLQDVEKGNYLELEIIVGEPLKEGEAHGVPMPVLRTIYGILKGLQLHIKEAKGLWEPKFAEDNPYQ